MNKSSHINYRLLFHFVASIYEFYQVGYSYRLCAISRQEGELLPIPNRLEDFLNLYLVHVITKAVCVVEETERGWYVTYIERDPALLARKEAQRKKTEADAKEEQMAAQQRDNLRKEAARALDRAGCTVDRKASEIGRRDGGNMDMKLGLVWKKIDKGGKQKNKSKKKVSLLEEDDEDVNDAQSSDDVVIQKQLSKRELNNHQSEKGAFAKKQKTNNDSNHKRADYWLHRNIHVRIISKKLASGEYYKRKAIVNKVIHKYEAEVKVLPDSRHARDGGDILRLDQDDLETVIPKGVGEKVRILNGIYRGWQAQVTRLDKVKHLGELLLVKDDVEGGDGKMVSLGYEDFSKIA